MIDLHCHIDLYANPYEVVRRCREDNIYVLSVTTTPKAWEGTSALARDCPRIRTALGLHPELAHERFREIELFDSLLPKTRYVGEVGLDGSPALHLHWKTQVEVFDHILRSVAAAGGRVMSIHSRRAVVPVLNALSRNADAGVPVLHWFTGTKAQLERAVAIGCWFSVGPAMLRSQRGRALVAAMPVDRVLTETDGPFATKNELPLQPADVREVVGELAAIWNTDHSEVEERLTESLRRLLRSS